jgi:putative sterol carrier protein
VKDTHLREVMAGSFRGIVLEEIFRRLPEFVDREKARKQRITVGFKITGRADGDADRYVVLLEEGECRVEPAGDQERHATVTAGGVAFLKLVTGNLGPVRAVVKGDIRVSGDPAKALAFSKIVRIPSPKG